MSSPSKRRRTTPDSYITINGDRDRDHPTTGVATPKRASYLSPTKASLSRSNPKLLQNAAQEKQSRESEPNRRQSLRDAVLGNRPRPAIEDSRSESTPLNHTNPQPDTTIRRTPSNEDHNLKITSQFSGDSERPNTPSNHDQNSQPLGNDQGQTFSTPRRNRSVARFASPSIVPQLVTSPRRSTSRTETFEVELPPTPVQLGKDKAPDRPRGLLSSSPVSSGRRRLRIRGGDIHSSPLKPKEAAPAFSGDEEDVRDSVEIASGIDDDSREDISSMRHEASDAVQHLEGVMAVSDESLDHDARSKGHSGMKEKEKQLKTLQARLASLKKDLNQLQTFRTSLGKSRNINPESIEAGFEHLQQQIDLSAPVSALPTDNHPLFQEHSAPYLGLFGPRNLVMSYETWERVVSGCQKLVYQTTFAASKPWPASTFTLSWETLINCEDNAVEQINFIANESFQQRELIKWTQKRLQNSTMKYDLATLVSGADAYFEAAIQRARLWSALTDSLSLPGEKANHLDGGVSDQQVSPEEAKILFPLLSTTQHTFSSIGLNQRTRRTLGSAKQLMLAYEIDLDWIGQANIRTDIFTTGFNSETTESAKTLFHSIESVSGVLKAFNEVRKILGMDSNADSEANDKGNATASGKMRTKKGKARRMTAFE